MFIRVAQLITAQLRDCGRSCAVDADPGWKASTDFRRVLDTAWSSILRFLAAPRRVLVFAACVPKSFKLMPTSRPEGDPKESRTRPVETNRLL